MRFIFLRMPGSPQWQGKLFFQTYSTKKKNYNFGDAEL